MTTKPANKRSRQTRPAVGAAREAAKRTASRITSGKKPVARWAQAGLALNTISHDAIAGFVQLQRRFVEESLENGAERFERAAKANSVRELVASQIELMPATRRRVTGSAKEALQIVAKAGKDVTTALTGETTRRKATKKKATTRRKSSKKVETKAA